MLKKECDLMVGYRSQFFVPMPNMCSFVIFEINEHDPVRRYNDIVLQALLYDLLYTPVINVYE